MKMSSNKRYSYQKPNNFDIFIQPNIINFYKADNRNELDEIFKLIRDESVTNEDPPFNSVKKLSIYIRRNRNSIQNIINRINELVKVITNVNLVINIIKTILDLVIEGRNHHLKDIIDILIKKLDNIPLSSSVSIEKIINTIGDLINLDNISLQKYLENIINKIIFTLTRTSESKNVKSENSKFCSILLLAKIIENSSLLAYNIIAKEENFEAFHKILENYKDNKIFVRYAVGELIKQFNHIIKNRDYDSKQKYQTMIFDIICSDYKNHLKENKGEPNNINLISGIIFVLRNIYNSEPSYLIKNENMYLNILEELSKCIKSKSNNIKIQFIKFAPELFKMNKEIFTKKYLNTFLEECNRYLSVKSNNDLRKSLFVTLGYFSLHVQKKDFKICLSNLISLLKNLVSEKNINDDEIFKCLADLLSNKQSLYLEVILTKFDINSILLKIFKNGLTTYKIEFLISIMTGFSKFSKQYISTAIASLHAVSIILCDEDFKFEFFFKELDNLGVKDNFIDENLDSILSNMRKYIRKYINDNFNEKNVNIQKNDLKNEIGQIPDYINCKCLYDLKTIIYALTLFSSIEYNLFMRDMLIFYTEKILPLLSVSKNKIKKKILSLLTNKFIKTFHEDKNYSEYLIFNIIDSISYLALNIKDVSTQVYAFQILQRNDLFLDIILKNKEEYCNRINSIIVGDIDKELKKVLIKMIGNLMRRSNDKIFFSCLVKKCINNYLFQIDNCEDIIFKEDLIELIYYNSVYLKNILDIHIIEKILESLTNLNMNYNYEGNILVLSFKIAYELLSSELINYNFLININYSKAVTIHCYIILIFIVNYLKEGGDNPVKTKISLKVLYQIIKILKIDIYNEINPNISLDSFDFFEKKNLSIKNNESEKIITQESKVNNINNENFMNINKQNSLNFNYVDKLSIETKKKEKINLVDILIQCIIKGQNDDENLNIIMNIFGLSGSMDPLIMEKLFFTRDVSMYRFEINSYNKNNLEENSFKVQKYNHKNRINEELNLSNIEPIKYKPILYILKILKENTQQELVRQIIINFNLFMANLEPNDEKLVEIILPNIIQIIPNLNNSQKDVLFTSIKSLIQNYKRVVKENLKDLINLTKNYIVIDLYFDKCFDIFKFLFLNFVKEMEIYYNELIPIFLSFINYNYNQKDGKGKKYINHIIDLFVFMTKNENIYSYLNIILDKIIPLFLRTNDFNDDLIIFYEKIIDLFASSDFYPLLINSLIEKLKIFMKDKTYLMKGKNSELTMTKEGKRFFDKVLHIFKDMYLINTKYFINFLSMIIKNIKSISIIKYNDYEKIIYPMLVEYPNYYILNISNYRTKKIISSCFPVCKLGFTNLKKGKNILKNDKKYQDTSLLRTSRRLTSIDSQNLKSSINIKRNQSIDDDLIIKAFDTSNCLTQKDWHEWFKSTTKVLFDQSPSVYLSSSKILADYYYPLINELYNYSFLDIYKNFNETKKTYLSSNISKALENPKTPNEILLAILNLEEFSERNNVDMCFLDNYFFGKVSYKCKAYAKALYFFENNFTNKNDVNDIKDLLELYYELKLPESAIGLLLKSSEKNKNKIRRRNSIIIEDDKNLDESFYQERKSYAVIEKEKEYIFYMKMHDYERALDIISKLLENEENNESIEVLKKNKNLCLNGLYDWEELLSNNKENNELDKELYEPKEIDDNNKNNNINTKVNIELNEDDEEKIKKNKIEEEILLSKASMNLGEWKELEKHLNNLKLYFTNNEDSKEIYLNNSSVNIYDFNYLRLSCGDDENTFCINHTLSCGTNMNSYDEDYIHFNMYIENYNKNRMENEYNPNLIKNNNSIIYNMNLKEENNEQFQSYNKFINYKQLIAENRKFDFLENNEDILFELNLYSSIINIENSKYDLAINYIYEAKKTILSRIKSLLNESYVRGYELLAKNQLLFNLEQIIDYKKNHFNDKLYFNQLVNLWDKNLNIIGKDLNIYENFLAIRSLILPIEKDYTKYMDFVKICRKLNLYRKGEKVLLRLKNKLKEQNINKEKNNIFNNIFVQIELSYNKCLFEKGSIQESINKSKYLVDLLDNSLSDVDKKSEDLLNHDLSKLDDTIKSKIYGNYAIYKSKIFDYENKISKDGPEKGNIIINIGPNISISKKMCKSSSNIINIKLVSKSVNDNDKETINHYFSLALKYNKNSYKLWHNYAMFNYKYAKFISMQNNKDDIEKNNMNKTNNKEILFATNAINGFKNSLFIGGKNKQKTFQDILRLLDIFFSVGNKTDSLLSLINETFQYIDIEVFINVIPQLLSRLDIQDNKILDVLLNILTKIGLTHPHAILSPLIVMKHSSSKKRKSSSEKVLETIVNKNNSLKHLIDEYEIFINELNKCAMLLHEEWSETIEDILKIYQSGDYNSFSNQMMKLHEKIPKRPKSMYEINFYQKFISELKEAEENLFYYNQTKKVEYIKTSWELYHNIYIKMSEYYKSFKILSLEYISPNLFNFKDSNIVVPSIYTSISLSQNKENLDINKINSIIYIKRMGKTLSIFNTKQHPRQMTMIGTDNKEYMFLLKGHEDLRQDERVMQLFDLVNIILAKNNAMCNKKLFIDIYTVFPISHNSGIIGWVRNCDTLHQIIKEQRMKTNTIPSIEHKKIYKLYPKFETGAFLTKVETFKEALNETNGREIKITIWERSKNCETWLNRRTNYSRSLAVMSIVGYILGLGDRHPSNLMMSRKNGKIIHIDFGDCFEITMKREKFPEKVPFRLTKMLIKALEVSGIEGTFRLICIQIMELLRKKRDSLLAILGSFVDDPLISFRLMIPMILRKRRMTQQIKIKENKKNNNKDEKNENKDKIKNINKNIINKINNNKKNIFGLKHNSHNNFESHLMKLNLEDSFKEKNQILKNSEENRKISSLKGYEKREEKKVLEYKNEEEEKEKEEKKKMEDDERLLFNFFEENDQFEQEELNEIAQMVLNRIKDKLSGTDIYPDSVYDAQTQVDKLITQATSFENLAQSYLGWCPFW